MQTRTSCGKRPSEGVCSGREHAFHSGHHHQPHINRGIQMVTMVTMGGDLQPGCLADRLLTGLGQPQINP